MADVAWTSGVTAAFGTAWAAILARQPAYHRRIAAALMPTAAAGMVAAGLLVPLLHSTPLPSGAIAPRLVNAQAGLLVTAYLVAPAVRVLAGVGVWSRRGRRRLTPAAWIWTAWAVSLSVALGGRHGFDRWAVGPLLHHVL